jgi:putative hemolysin
VRRIISFKGDEDAPRLERIAMGGIAGLLMLLWYMGDQATGMRSAAAEELPLSTVAPEVLQRFLLPIESGWAFLFLLIAIIFVNALFVAAETALDMLTSLHVKHAASEKATQRLQGFLEKQPKYVAACSLGSQVARMALFFSALLLAQDLALILAGRFGWIFNYGTILIAAVIILIPALLVNVVLGELVPKSFATMHPDRVALALGGFIRVVAVVFAVPARVVVRIANLVASRFGGKASFTAASQAEEQIKSLVETAQESGAIEDEERELLHSVFEFTDTVVREVMTPRVDLEAVPINAEPEAVVRIIEESGHSRIPLYVDTDDQIVGVIHAKDLLMAMVSNKNVRLRSFMRPALFLTETMTLQEALKEMRLNRAELAIVQDEYGGTAGIVTTEDIVEELVGEIVDEYDVEEEEVVQTETGFLIDGKTHLDDLNDEIGSSFESEEFDTIGGYVFGLFGRQPKEGETINVDSFVFTVAETDGKRIQKLAVRQEAAASSQVPEN